MAALAATANGDLDRTRRRKKALLGAHNDVHRTALRQTDTGRGIGFCAIRDTETRPPVGD